MEKVGPSTSAQAYQSAGTPEHDTAVPAPAPDGNTKRLCDYNLQEHMAPDCAAQGGGLLCDVVARIHYEAVHLRGTEAYENAQKAAK